MKRGAGTKSCCCGILGRDTRPETLHLSRRRQARRAGQEAVAEPGGGRRGGLLARRHGQEPHGPAQRGQQVGRCARESQPCRPTSAVDARKHGDWLAGLGSLPTWAPRCMLRMLRSSTRQGHLIFSHPFRTPQPQDADLPHPDVEPHVPGLRLQPAARAPLPQGGGREGH